MFDVISIKVCYSRSTIDAHEPISLTQTFLDAKIPTFKWCIWPFFFDIYDPTNVRVKDIGSWASMVLLDYQNLIEMTSNMIYIVALGVGLNVLLKSI